MSTEVQEQSADYNLADLKPTIEKAAGNTLLNSLPIWLSAQTTKSAGRGRSAENTHQYGVQKLRELILELAVRGKLVEQDPYDEPASVLLEKIAEEKARLVKEGKIKKQKPITGTHAQASYDEIPKQWAKAFLGNFAYLEMGQSPASKYYNQSGEGMPFFQGKADFNDTYPTVRYWCVEPAKLAYMGDVLLSVRAPVGPTNIANIDCCIGRGLAALRPVGSTPTGFLRILIKASEQELKSRATGTTFSAVSKKDIETVSVLIPPLAEQHRIVKKVDELMVLCDKLEQQQADAVQAHDTLVKVLLDTLTQSDNAEDFQQNWRRIAEHFDTLFTTESSIDQLKQTLLQLAVMGKLVPQDPNEKPASVLLEKIADEKKQLVEEGIIKKSKKLPAITEDEQMFSLPNGWTWTRLETLFNVIVDCPHSTPKFKDAGKLCIDTNSFKDGKLLRHRLRYVSDETFESRNSRLMPEYRDIVFAREGSVGESVVIPANLECCLGQRVMLFRPSATLNPYFLRLTLSSEIALRALLSLHKGIGAKHVNVGDMRKYVVACPPPKEQHRIVKKVDELLALCDQIKERLNQAQSLQKQLADAFVESTVSKES